MVMFRHKEFCQELARPVSYSHAQRFRWMTVLHAYAPILVVTAFFFDFPWTQDFKELIEAVGTVLPFAIAQACTLVFLAAATGIPSYYYHPKALSVELQNRAIAMSYYATAALAWSFLPAVCAVLGYVLRPIHETTGFLFMLIAFLVPFGLLTAWWLDLIHIALRVMPHLRGRAVALAVGVPLLWLILCMLILAGLPLVVLYVYVVFASPA